ncbi:MAG: aminotransferase class III-fold pyridoxal phosphate-dependent enzyme [Saprospiraceae bacterium]|nr:aminotransferase class III-fold pyridoxal phosphate-dependent enzyme [Saprospiraceae bacterium]
MDFKELDLSEDFAANLALKFFGIKGKISKLPGEVDFNFYVRTSDAEYTLKVTRPDTDESYIAFQCAIVKHLFASDFPLQIPEIIPALNGQDFISLENKRFLRLQRWVPGQMVDNVSPRSQGLLKSWGRTCGLFSKYLSGFDHPGAHRKQKWNPSETLKGKKYRPYFQSEEELEIADYFWVLFEREVTPELVALGKSINYNDAHEHNLLVHGDLKNPRITGVIDFGDALYTETINELAIACAYACMYQPDPLQAAVDVVRGYQQEFPLTEIEISVLFPLIAARLMLTVANAAWNKHFEPENTYLLVSEKPAWDLLKKLRDIAPSFAYYRFRNACNLEACPKKNIFRDWIDKQAANIYPVISFQEKKVKSIDLSVGSLELGNNSNFETIDSFVTTINRILEDKDADIGIGGYGEVRPFYATSAFQNEGNQGARWRTVHLGVDLWSPVGTEIYAPLDGEVYSVKNNEGECNYGPTIILKHQVEKDLIFYSLYGHLSEGSLEGKCASQLVKRGDVIATIGSAPANGNWPSHLHFQIMLDHLSLNGDFPGVAYPDEALTWLSICPDPNLFFNQKSNHFPSLPDDQILNLREQKLGRSLSISYEKPLHMVRGYMQHLYDTSGRRYLDTVNNVAHVGHQHPRVVGAARRQMEVLNTNTRYLHQNIVLFAEELLATFPEELCVVHFVNSGSEANELALRMVEAYTGQKDMIAVEVGYHGNTNGCIAISSYKFDGKGGRGRPPGTQIVPIPDAYRGIYRGDHTGVAYAAHIGHAIDHIHDLGRKVGGFICESILSCGGQIVLPDEYLKEAYQQIHAAGGLCIADEVQVGFGRVGEYFWGFELQGVMPDIVTLGKPIGNGHPLGAVVTSRKIADTFANGMEYFNTFGGNPVSCAIGREVLKIVQEEGLQDQAKEVGQYLSLRLGDLQRRWPLIGDVRGHGLFIGIELVKSRETLMPAPDEASYISNRMRERGILMSTDGPFNNVLKIKPPMCFDQNNADFLLKNLEIILKESFLRLD